MRSTGLDLGRLPRAKPIIGARTPPFVKLVVRRDNAYAVVLDDDGVPFVARFGIGR